MFKIVKPKLSLLLVFDCATMTWHLHVPLPYYLREAGICNAKKQLHIQGCSFVNMHLAAAGAKTAGKHSKGFITRSLTGVETQSVTKESKRGAP